MSRRLALGAPAILAGLFCLLGADCVTGPPDYPAREFVAELHSSNTLGNNQRSQFGRPHPDNAASEPTDLPGAPTAVYWPGTAAQVNIQMAPPVDLNVLVLDGDGNPTEDTCLLLDAIGTLADRGTRTEPGSGLIGKKVTPHEYEALVAPTCLLGETPALGLQPLSIQANIPASSPLELSVPESVDVEGRIETVSGDAIGGMIITLFDAERPEVFLGVSTRSATDGTFTLAVPVPPADCGQPGALPCPTYDVAVSAPPDGSVAMPPIRLRNVVLPLASGFTLLARYPSDTAVTIRGDVVLEAGQAPYVTRLRVEGLIPEPPGSTEQFTGGMYRIEIRTDEDGRFEFEGPPGSYTVTAIPDYDDAQTLDLGRLDFDVPPTVPSVDNLSLEVPLASFARIEVLDDTGSNVAGATLNLRRLEAPHYSFRKTTLDTLGGWSGPLMAGVYSVEVVPPLETDPETGEQGKTWARVHGTLDHTGESSILQLFLRRSDPLEGFVYGPPTAEPGVQAEGAPGVQVLLLDPETGKILDETTTASETGAGFFRALLPRQ